MGTRQRNDKAKFNANRLLPACIAALLAGGFDAPAQAGSAQQTFDIPAQPMDSALTELADRAGLRLLYQAGAVGALRSRPVSGRHTPEQALKIMLADSGLTYRKTAGGAITVAQAVGRDETEKGNEATTLKPMTVTGAAEYDSTDPFNPDYNRTVASTATKTDTPIMETPVSIQVVPKAVINDQQAIRVGDALRNVSGYFDSRGEEFFYDTAFLRGFDTGSSQYIDGLRDISQSHSLSNIERIEVLKGPAGALYGRLEPGGLINYVTKRPLDTPYYSLQQQFGSYDLYRTQIDSTGPITQEGNLLYRFNMEYLNSNSFVDVVHKERGFVAPSLTWKISPQTRVDVDFRYHDVNGPTTFGLPAVGNRPANVPVSRYFGEPSLDDGDFNTLYGGLSLSHAFSDNWKLDAKAGYNDHHEFSQGIGIDVLDESSGNASRWLSNYDYDMNSIQGLINVTGKFNTWGIQHTLAVGGDIYQTEMRTNSWQYLCDGCSASFPAPINIYQEMTYGQTPGARPDLEPLGPGSSGVDEWWGLYIQDQVTIRKDWHLMFGTRYDQARSSWDDSPTTDDGEFSPRVGLLYRPISWLSLFANYSKAMNAANASLVSPGTQRKPEMSEGYEAGLKGEWWNGRLTANLSVYELTKKNIAQPNPDPALASQGYSIFVGKGRSQGIEFDVSGSVTNHWSLIGTYSYTNTKVLEDDTGIAGNQFVNVPRHAGSVWSKYDFSGLGVTGLWSGAGVYLVGQRQGNNENTFQMPGYARVDAAVGYALNVGPSKISLQFNVDNLLDKTYFTSSTWASRTGGIQPGSPRTFLGSIRVEF